jgi:CRISPR-associated protein Csb1
MTSEQQKLTLELIEASLQGEGAAFRMRARLQPAGGVGDKVFPPTYAESQSGGKHTTKYATETRVVDGQRKPAVLLDSVASQANRMELQLLEACRSGAIDLPLLSVDFGSEFPDLGKISSLETPHRIYDAIFRDSILDGAAFRQSEVGRSITEARPGDARALLKHCPTALLFGAWDSTGPLGGRGSKFQRCLVSEVVGIDFEAGSKVGSRIDPLEISSAVRVKIPKERSDNWSLDDEGKGKPSEVNHSNIAPTRDEEAGGVTMDHGLHTAVLSLASLRRIHFGDWEDEACGSAQTLLAALGLLAMVLQRQAGYDFRSRCTLVPEGPIGLELVNADGTLQHLSLDPEGAIQLFGEALAKAKQAGAMWESEELVLKPAEKLSQLIDQSRKVMAAGAEAE